MESSYRILARINSAAVLALVAVVTGVIIRAEAAPPPEQQIVVTGKIVDPESKPVSGAFVAAYDAKKNVVSSVHTNARGEYSLAVPRSALHVDIKGKTFV